MDPEAMLSLDSTYYVGSYDLAFILLDSVRAELVYGPSSARSAVAGMASFVLGSCLF